MPPPVGIAALALGPVAGTVAGEDWVGVSPDVIGRKLRLQAGKVSKGIVLAAEHYYEGAALARSESEHFHIQVHYLATPPVHGPLAHDKHPSAGNLAEVEAGLPLVVVQEHPALRVVVEQPLYKPPALGRPRVRRNAIGNGHGLFGPRAGQRGNYTLNTLQDAGAGLARSGRPDFFLAMRQAQLARQF